MNADDTRNEFFDYAVAGDQFTPEANGESAALPTEIAPGQESAGTIADLAPLAAPLPADDADKRGNPAETPLPAPPRRSRFLILAAFAMCLASVAAYICAGIFVADAVMGRGARLFFGELAAAKEQSAEAIEAIHIAPREIAEESETDQPETADETAAAEAKTYPVEGADMSCADPFSLANETKYDPDVAALTSAEAFASFCASPSTEEAPLVLVIHTHSTEAYLPEGTDTYSDETSFRSLEASENMIAVGDALCLALGQAGIRSVHCTENFDSESFIHSYEKSAEAVSRYLAENPSIRYVLDVHRDAIFRPDGALLAPRTPDGAAQVMIVCGTDEMGADFPAWRENLAFAFAIQAAAGERCPGLMRNVNLRGASFNEQLAERYLLVEIGSAGNSLDEAKLAAERFAGAFAAVIGLAD